QLVAFNTVGPDCSAHEAPIELFGSISMRCQFLPPSVDSISQTGYPALGQLSWAPSTKCNGFVGSIEMLARLGTTAVFPLGFPPTYSGTEVVGARIFVH